MSANTFVEALNALFSDDESVTPTNAHVSALKDIESTENLPMDDLEEHEDFDPDALNRFEEFLEDPELYLEDEEGDRKTRLEELFSGTDDTSDDDADTDNDEDSNTDDTDDTNMDDADDTPDEDEPKSFMDMLRRSKKKEVGGGDDSGDRKEIGTDDDDGKDEKENKRKRKDRKGSEDTDERDKGGRLSRRVSSLEKRMKKLDESKQRPHIVEMSDAHLIARIHRDPRWVAVRDMLFSYFQRLEGDDPDDVETAQHLLNTFEKQIKYGGLRKCYPPNFARLIDEIIMNLYEERYDRDPDFFEARYGALYEIPVETSDSTDD